jgi:hypothetical protein
MNMFWLIGLLVLETVLEGLLCSGVIEMPRRQRKLTSTFLGILLACTLIALSYMSWEIWIWSTFFGAYRLINLRRIYKARLTPVRLRSVTIRAFSWLVAAQTITTVLAWAAYEFHWHRILLDVLMAVQLLCAFVLLRATVHTWRHAAVPQDTPAMTDRELPSVSVLIPARNETTDLELCLQMLITSDYPKLEILVLDDCSINRHTPEVIRSFAHAGVRFISGEVPDETRWLAKNFAYDRLAKEASGDILLFCGVDAMLMPNSIRRLVGILEARKKNMLSVLPMRKTFNTEGNSLFQAMRYYWELCLPRGFFKRPPVLSTCWIIRRENLIKMGGFESVSHSVIPEATFAQQAVTTDTYSFIRSDDDLGVYSNKPSSAQYATSVRVRYPQLHKRLELVAFVTFLEMVLILGPILGLLVASNLQHTMEYVAAWGVSLLFLLVTYGFASVGSRLTNPLYGWALMPAAFVLDMVVLHISLWRYEFGTVDWKGRNVCLPVMQLAEVKS